MSFDDPFEIVIVEDGSTQSSEGVITTYQDRLNISYYKKPNSGPGDSRNYGMQRAKGNYFIVLDSDVLMPADYLNTVHEFLSINFHHCFGGADGSIYKIVNGDGGNSFKMREDIL